jgi:hypothetical protein
MHRPHEGERPAAAQGGRDKRDPRGPAAPAANPRLAVPDSVPQPVVSEDASDSAWDRFDALLNADKVDFDSTQSSLHMPLNNDGWSPTRPGALPTEGKWRLQIEAEVGEVLALARQKNRAAPVPHVWDEFYRMLPRAEHGGRSHSAPPPLALDQSTPMQRRLRLRDQIEWAEVAGALREAHAFLASLADTDWTYFDRAG